MNQDNTRAVDEIFSLQQEARWETSKSNAATRIGWLERLRDAIEAEKAAIEAALRADFRKHHIETEITEIHPVLEETEHAIDHLEEWMSPQPVKKPVALAGTANWVRYEALGNVLIMAPWNYPFHLMISPLVAAIAAGNTAILRPSQKTPNTSDVIERILERCFDTRHVAMIRGGYDVADYLLEQPFDHYFFTGSPRIGKKVMRAAAEHLATVTLELGGKSPGIVTRDANLDVAARRLAWGKFMNAGQTCVAPDYIAVHESVAEVFVSKLVDAVKAEYGPTAYARKQSDDFARVIDDGAFEHLTRLLEESTAAGATVEIGGESDADERYVAPTVLSDVTWDSPAMADEIFGPIFPVVEYRDRREVYDFIRRSGKPLALYMFTESDAVRDEILENTSSGGAVVNTCVLHLANPHLPFGGVGQSGQGHYHGFWGFTELSNERAVMHRGKIGFVEFFHPPYHGKMTEWALRVLRITR